MFGWVKRLFKKEPHKCVGKVMRCSPHDMPQRVSTGGYGESVLKEVKGTNILMKCECGRWVIQWVPGVWSVSDFTGEQAIDMDKAFAPAFPMPRVEVDDE